MSFTTRLTPDSGYQTLLAAVARGRDVPRAWLDHARRAEQHQAEETTAAAQLAADLEAAHTANTARIKAREDKARKDVPPLIKELDAAKEKAMLAYEEARTAVEKAQDAYREASACHAAIKSYVHGLVAGDELPRDQDGNITGVTAYVNPVTGGVYFEGELISAPQPFKA